MAMADRMVLPSDANHTGGDTRVRARFGCELREQTLLESIRRLVG